MGFSIVADTLFDGQVSQEFSYVTESCSLDTKCQNKFSGCLRTHLAVHCYAVETKAPLTSEKVQQRVHTAKWSSALNMTESTDMCRTKKQNSVSVSRISPPSNHFWTVVVWLNREKNRHWSPTHTYTHTPYSWYSGFCFVQSPVRLGVVWVCAMKLKELNAHRMDLNKPERLSWIFYLALCKSCSKTQTRTCVGPIFKCIGTRCVKLLVVILVFGTNCCFCQWNIETMQEKISKYVCVCVFAERFRRKTWTR